MLFRYYFFKENTREYRQLDLIKFFTSNPYFTKNSTSYYSFVYYNVDLDFTAKFHLAPKAMLKSSEKLNPKYLDTNVYVEFDNLTPSYNVSLILDICEEICRDFNFKIYNEFLKDVIPFKKNVLLNAFNISKAVYKDKYPEHIAEYYKCDSKLLDRVYDYLSQKTLLLDLLGINGIEVPNIKYYCVVGKRKVYTSIDVNLSEPFVLPAFIDMIRIVDDKYRAFISLDEFLDKARKYFHPIESNVANLYYVTQKDMKKIIKIISKTHFSPLILELKEVEFKKVLDI